MEICPICKTLFGIGTPFTSALFKLKPTVFPPFKGWLAAALSLLAALSFLVRKKGMPEPTTHKTGDI